MKHRAKRQWKRTSALQVIFSDGWHEAAYHTLSIKLRGAWAVKAKALLRGLKIEAKRARWAQAAVVDEAGEWLISGTGGVNEHEAVSTAAAYGWIPGGPLAAKQDAEWEATARLEEWRSAVMENEERAWATFYMMQDLDYDESIYPHGWRSPDYPNFLRSDEDYAFRMSKDWETWEDEEEWELVEEEDEEEQEKGEHSGIRVEECSRALLNKERRKNVGLLHVIRMREVHRREWSPGCEVDEGLEDMLSEEWIPGHVAMGRMEREWNSLRDMGEEDRGVEVAPVPVDWGSDDQRGLVSDFEARHGNDHARRRMQGKNGKRPAVGSLQEQLQKFVEAVPEQVKERRRERRMAEKTLTLGDEARIAWESWADGVGMMRVKDFGQRGGSKGTREKAKEDPVATAAGEDDEETRKLVEAGWAAVLRGLRVQLEQDQAKDRRVRRVKGGEEEEEEEEKEGRDDDDDAVMPWGSKKNATLAAATTNTRPAKETGPAMKGPKPGVRGVVKASAGLAPMWGYFGHGSMGKGGTMNATSAGFGFRR